MSGIVVWVDGRRYWFPCEVREERLVISSQVLPLLESHGVGWRFCDNDQAAEEYRPSKGGA